MNRIIILCVTLTVTYSSVFAATQAACLEMFEDGEYSKVINACEKLKKDSTDLGFAVLASQLFSQVSEEKIDQIFYSGIDTGIDGYYSKNGEPTYTNLEKYYIREYFSEMAALAEKGHSQARALTAKMHFIDSLIFSRSRYSGLNGKKAKDFQMYYIKNLEHLLKENPNDVEILFLLGQQGVKLQMVQGDWRTIYYQIVDQEYYTFLKKAEEMGDPRAYYINQGVKRWNDHVGHLEKKASTNNTAALRELGYSLLHDGATTADYEQAIKLLEQAAQQGDVPSLMALASLYKRNMKNETKYVSTLQRAVKLNNTQAMIDLGDYYFCKKLKAKAKMLYQQAIEAGEPLAETALQGLQHDSEPIYGCVWKWDASASRS